MTFGAPHLTGDRLAFAALTTAYLLVAVPWEERSLARTYSGPNTRIIRRGFAGGSSRTSTERCSVARHCQREASLWTAQVARERSPVRLRGPLRGSPSCIGGAGGSHRSSSGFCRDRAPRAAPSRATSGSRRACAARRCRRTPTSRAASAARRPRACRRFATSSSTCAARRARGPLPVATHEIRQEGESFHPRVLAITRGSSVGFPNADPVLPQRLLAVERGHLQPGTLPARADAPARVHQAGPRQGVLPDPLAHERDDSGARSPVLRGARARRHVRARRRASRAATRSSAGTSGWASGPAPWRSRRARACPSI